MRIASLALLLVVACEPPTPDRSSARVTVRLGGRAIDAALAETEADRRAAFARHAAGAEVEPFLLAWPRERIHHYHADSVREDLVVVLLSRDREVVEVLRLHAFDDIGVTSERPAQFALILPVEEGFEPEGVAEIEPRPEAQEMVTLRIGDARLPVEMALNNRERARGLMHRPRMDESEGMLFVYAREIPADGGHYFWMRNTHIPLDLAYIGEDGVIDDILPMHPDHDFRYMPSEPHRYALEVSRGWFEAHGITEGAPIEWPEEFERWLRTAE